MTSPGVFGTILAVVAGVWASVFSAELRGGPFSTVGGVLVALIVGALVGFVLEARLQRRRQRWASTLPSETFIHEFGVLWQQSSAVVWTLRANRADQDNPEAIREVIREILYVVAVLACRFDGRQDGTLYAANVMRYIDLTQSTPEMRTSLEPRMKFLGARLSAVWQTLEGVLDLDRSLSVRFVTPLGRDRGKSYEVDDDLPDLALPVPSEYRASNGRWRVVPGAPMAFVGGNLVGYQDTKTMGDWCQKNTDLPGSVADEVSAYFHTPPVPVRSLVSIPIIEGHTKRRFGVLNLHRDQHGMLGDETQCKRFYSFVRPFISTLAYLLLYLDRAKNA